MNYFSNYCLFLIYTHWLEEIHDYHRPFRHSAFLISVMNLLKSLHSLISFFLVQILWACYDIQQASIFTHFLTLNSSVFLNQFNVWLLSHHKSCSCTYKPVALVRLQKVLIIHYQQNEILVWSTSSKNRVLKFVIHEKKKKDKNKTTKVDTEVVDYNRGDLRWSPKNTENTHKHIKYCVPPDRITSSWPKVKRSAQEEAARSRFIDRHGL